MNTRSQLVADACQIAVHIGYTNLINGLQPAEKLLEKYVHEWQEYKEALATKTYEHVIHEACDLLYYSACLDTQNPDWPFVPYDGFYEATMTAIRHNLEVRLFRSLDVEQVEAAALAKYNWRASGKNNKDEAYELRLIAESIGKEQ